MLRAAPFRSLTRRPRTARGKKDRYPRHLWRVRNRATQDCRSSAALEGRANEALLAFLAQTFARPKNAVN